jgi:hypothetical protein
MMVIGEGFAQPRSALQKANHVRAARREFKRQLADGELTLVELFGDPPSEILTAKTIDVLMWMPGIGPTRARSLLLKPYIVVPPHVLVEHLSAGTRQRICARLDAALPRRIVAA